MRTWLVAGVGLMIALAAIYAVVTGVFTGNSSGSGTEIDAASRAGLRAVLKEAEQEP